MRSALPGEKGKKGSSVCTEGYKEKREEKRKKRNSCREKKGGAARRSPELLPIRSFRSLNLSLPVARGRGRKKDTAFASEGEEGGQVEEVRQSVLHSSFTTEAVSALTRILTRSLRGGERRGKKKACCD